MYPAYARVVVDTNVILSAALSPQGTPARLIDRLLESSLFVFSQVTFDELAARIWKPKFDPYLAMEHRRQILKELNACALWVEPSAELTSKTFSRDPADDAFIHAAQAAEVTRLISGDEDLLCLHPLAELQILTPRAAMDEIAQHGDLS